MTHSNFDGTMYDGLNDYDAMDVLIDNIEEDGKAKERIEYFMTLIKDEKLWKALKELVEKRITDELMTDDDIAEALRQIREEIAECDCEECIAQKEEDKQQDQEDDWDEWSGWGTGMECEKCGAGEIRVDGHDIWCNNKECKRSGQIKWDDEQEDTTTT